MTIERAARKQFIHGLRDDDSRRHLKTHPDYTLKEVLDYVESIDSIIFEDRGASFSPVLSSTAFSHVFCA
jgi:hypothetical protein